MDIKLNQTSSNQASIVITLQEADYATRVDKKLKDFSKKASIKGFRPGKVPASLIKKMYGTSLLVEEVNQLLYETVSNYIKENNLNILGEPIPDRDEAAKINWDTQKEFTFNYEIGIVPEFNLNLDSSFSVEKYEVELDDQTMEETFDHLKKQFGKTINPETSEAGDYLFGQLKQIDGSFDSKTLVPLNKVVSGIDKFVGKNLNETISFDIREAFGDDNNAIAQLTGVKKEEAADIKGTFEFNIEKITRTAEAELDQELFDKVFGKDAVTSVEEFKEKVSKTILENYDQESQKVLDNQIIDKLVKSTNIDVPQEFFKKWILFANQGNITSEQVEESFDKFTDELKWSLIRNKIITDHDIKVTRDEIKAATVQKMLAQFNLTEVPEELEENIKQYADNYLKQNEGKNYMNEYERIVSEKVIGLVKEKIAISPKKITTSEFRNIEF